MSVSIVLLQFRIIFVGMFKFLVLLSLCFVLYIEPEKNLAGIFSLGYQWQEIWWIKLFHYRCGQRSCNFRYLYFIVRPRRKYTKICVGVLQYSFSEGREGTLFKIERTCPYCLTSVTCFCRWTMPFMIQ